MWKSIAKDLFVETIAVFIGIMIALNLDNNKDRHTIQEQGHNYFGLMETQLGRDTIFISEEVEPGMKDQHRNINLFLAGKYKSLQLLKHTETTFVYKPPVELLNSLLSSNFYNTIYDSIIFNAISSQIKDFRLYMDLQQKIDEAQIKFADKYVYSHKDPGSGEIHTTGMTIDNRMINELTYLNGLYGARYTTLLSVQINYRKLLRQIKLRIH